MAGNEEKNDEKRREPCLQDLGGGRQALKRHPGYWQRAGISMKRPSERPIRPSARKATRQDTIIAMINSADRLIVLFAMTDLMASKIAGNRIFGRIRIGGIRYHEKPCCLSDRRNNFMRAPAGFISRCDEAVQFVADDSLRLLGAVPLHVGCR